MSEFRYGNEEDEQLRQHLDAVAWAMSRAHGPGYEVEVEQYRKPTVSDIDMGAICEFARRAWDGMVRAIEDAYVLEDWANEDGGPDLVDTEYFEVSGDWPLFTAMIGHFVRSNIDLSEAAWIPTGVVMRVDRNGVIDDPPPSQPDPTPTEDPRITKIRALLDGAGTWDDLASAIHGVITDGGVNE
jgi:hypothetical protein